MFKAFGLKRSGWASLFFEVITNPSKLTSIKHLIPLIFSNITRTFRNYIMDQNWKDLKLLMDEKTIPVQLETLLLDRRGQKKI